jgi:hypothetical protein
VFRTAFRKPDAEGRLVVGGSCRCVDDSELHSRHGVSLMVASGGCGGAVPACHRGRVLDVRDVAPGNRLWTGMVRGGLGYEMVGMRDRCGSGCGFPRLGDIGRMPLLEDWLATSSTSKAVVLAVVVGISRCATILALVIPGSRAMWLHLRNTPTVSDEKQPLQMLFPSLDLSTQRSDLSHA